MKPQRSTGDVDQRFISALVGVIPGAEIRFETQSHFTPD